MNLIIPCFIGEFGWELFGWQGFLRKTSKFYDHVTTFCRDRNKLLYEDFSDKIITITSKDLPDGDNVYSSNLLFYSNLPSDKFGLIEGISRQIDHFGDSDKFLREIDSYKWVPDYIPLGNISQKEYDAVIHLRNRRHRSHEDDSLEWNLSLIDFLSSKFNICAIGTTASAVNPRDYGRDIDVYFDNDLKSLSNIMRKSKICIGHSSGPMHFAALCETPICVWTNCVDNALRDRYRKHWNPFNVDVAYFPNRPSLSKIERVMKMALKIKKSKVCQSSGKMAL